MKADPLETCPNCNRSLAANRTAPTSLAGRYVDKGAEPGARLFCPCGAVYLLGDDGKAHEPDLIDRKRLERDPEVQRITRELRRFPDGYDQTEAVR